jgi:signal transduction histidine kinase
MDPQELDATKVRQRLERERRARREAETIAERVTADLYASKQELQSVNLELHATNELLESMNATMRDFVAVASHDLRGPLTSILGFTELLMNRGASLNDEQKSEFLSTIYRQGEHLGRLIDDLLTVSKIEAGALDVHPDVVGVHGALEEAICDQRGGGRVALAVPDDLAVFVDREHLNRIVVNLISNAFKYGSPPVEVEAHGSAEGAEIRVSDDGPGVPEDFRGRLFERFARADDKATRAQKGTGLGLSIVQGLAQANGGDVWYEPRQPHGSCFAVRLPAARASS